MSGQRIRRHAKQNPARVALVLLMCALIGLIVACVILFNSTTRATIEEGVRDSAQTAVQQIERNLNFRLEQTADSIRTLLGTIYPYLNSNAALQEQIDEYNNLNRIFGEYVGKYMVSKLRLYAPAEKIYSRQGDTFFSVSELTTDQAFHKMLNGKKGGVFWQEPHKGFDLAKSEHPLVISCVGVVVGRTNYEQIVGALFMDIPIDQIAELLHAAENMEICIVNEAGRILIHPRPELVGMQCALSTMMGDLGPDGCITLPDSIISYKRMESPGWYLLNTVLRANMYNIDSLQIRLLWLLTFVTLVIALGIAMVFVYNSMLQRAMITINEAIASLENGKGNTNAQKKGLSASASMIAETARRVTEERYHNRLAISEYQMKALQAQIKPHFLYNTLDVIKWMIVDHDYENSIWMVNALSKYLRLSINKGPGVVPVSEEIELTRAYLGIMQRRFHGTFSVSFDLEKDVLDCQIPKLSLQPLIENSLIHGLLYCDKLEKQLAMRAWKEDNMICLEVEDNGNGMSLEILKALEKETPASTIGYGIANVRRRLRLFGGEKSEFRIVSHEQCGICITIVLPAIHEPEGTD